MLKKQFLKKQPICKVTFKVPADQVQEAEKVSLLGEFNNWNSEEAIEMKKLKDGSFKTVVSLDAGKEYEFRYLVNGTDWLNDEEADKYVSTPFGTENCVVVA